MSIKQHIKIKTFTGSGSIDFEADQQDAMKKSDNIQSLADQVEKLESLNSYAMLLTPQVFYHMLRVFLLDQLKIVCCQFF